MQSTGASAWGAQRPPDKPRVRISSDGTVRSVNGAPMPATPTGDSYVNFLASVGAGTANLHTGSTYGFMPLTRQRTLLEWVYRGSWVVGVAVDAVADDMTKMGVDFAGGIPPDDSEALEAAMTRLQLWHQVNELIKWGRLYGGAIAVMLIEGQNPATPLRPETVGKGQFKGLLVLDRWRVEPNLNDLVSDAGPDMGLPKFYRMAGQVPMYEGQWVHYSRVIRYEGITVPWWQAVTEMLWGISIIERLWTRLTAFDSTTEGVAQLVYKAYLRIIKLKGLRELGAASPEAQRGLHRRIEVMQRFQTNEGVTLLDEADEFQAQSYSFSGLDTVLLQMGQQLSGALQIPLVRLFGQSPAGLNATGDSDWRNYYDGIHQQQELRLRRPMTNTIRVTAQSEGIALPPGFTFSFRSLWQLLPKEKADLAETVTRTVLSAEELGIISQKRALEELRQSARETGIWATITDKEIRDAEDETPPSGEGLLMPPSASLPGSAGGGLKPEPGQRQTGEGRLTAVAGGRQSLPVPIPRPSLGAGARSE